MSVSVASSDVEKARGNGMMFSKTEEGRMDCIIIWPAAAAVEERERVTRRWVYN